MVWWWRPSRYPAMTQLGRWCGQWSPQYATTCKPMQKGWLSDVDNSVWNAPPPKGKPYDDKENDDATKYDPLTRLLVSFHG